MVTVGVGEGDGFCVGVTVGITMTLVDGVGLADLVAEALPDALGGACVGSVTRGLNGLWPTGPLYAAGTATGTVDGDGVADFFACGTGADTVSVPLAE
jgi:hypothetical protein